MKKKTIYAGICNLKGGCGKSVITTLLASNLHYALGVNVLVIDGDYPQYSLVSMRERDTKMVSESSYFKELFYRQFQKTQKKGYAILKATPDNILEVAENYLQQNENIDIVFFDLPGATSSKGILETVLNLDYIFCPVITDRIVVQSSLSFISTIKEWVDKNKDSYPLKDVYLFWNRIDNRENKGIYNIANNLMSQLRIKVLRSELMETNKFKKELSAVRRDIFRSTLFPPNPSLVRGTGLDIFIQEFCRIIKLKI